MKILLFNGSTRKNGCTYTALSVIAQILKETLIKYSAHITQSDFSADCTKILQAYSRMSRDFCAFLTENMQVRCVLRL